MKYEETRKEENENNDYNGVPPKDYNPKCNCPEEAPCRVSGECKCGLVKALEKNGDKK